MNDRLRARDELPTRDPALTRRFDAMGEPFDVRVWFKEQMGFFFTEWPRGQTPLSVAIEAARASRHGPALEEFLAEMDAHWYAPLTTDPFARPMKFTVRLRDVKVLRPAPTGQRFYLKARGVVPGVGDRGLYVYFDKEADELAFEASFTGQDLDVETNEVQFTPGQGGAVREVLAWKYRERDI